MLPSGSNTLPHSHTWNPGHPSQVSTAGNFPSIQSLEAAQTAQTTYPFYPVTSFYSLNKCRIFTVQSHGSAVGFDALRTELPADCQPICNPPTTDTFSHSNGYKRTTTEYKRHAKSGGIGGQPFGGAAIQSVIRSGKFENGVLTTKFSFLIH